MTVYEKGAELVRMIHQLLGEATFQEGMALYFKRFDGMAVTIEDFYRSWPGFTIGFNPVQTVVYPVRHP